MKFENYMTASKVDYKPLKKLLKKSWFDEMEIPDGSEGLGIIYDSPELPKDFVEKHKKTDDGGEFDKELSKFLGMDIMVHKTDGEFVFHLLD